MPRPIIIDTDPGIDDAIAIMLAAASAEVRILGIVAVAGNVGLDRTAANAAALADLLHLDCPVGEGASGPLRRENVSESDTVHGADGLGGYRLPVSTRPREEGVALLARLIEESAEPVTVVAIGPLTNIALLIEHHRDTARKVERFVIMGGGTGEATGNVTAAAEFNVWFDPDAAARVFSFDVPITMVGLNATHQALVGTEHLTGLRSSGGPLAAMVTHILDEYGDTWNPAGGAKPQHDALAVAALIDPTLVTLRRHPVEVETNGDVTAGMTVVDYRRGDGSVDVAFEVDVERFRTLLDTRLAALDTALRTA